MTDISSGKDFGRSHRVAPAEFSTFPVFRNVRNMLLVGNAAVIFVLLIAWFYFDTPLASPIVISVVAILLSVGSLILYRKLNDGLFHPLTQIKALLDRALEGQYDVPASLQPTAIPIIQNQFNQLVTSFELAKQALSERDLLTEIIEGIPAPVVVLDGNGVVQFSNSKFNERLSFQDDFSVLGKGVGTLSGQSMPNWYMALIRHGVIENEPVKFQTVDGNEVDLLLSGTMIQSPTDLSSRVVLVASTKNKMEQNHPDGMGVGNGAEQKMGEFQNLFDAIEDPITVLALNGEILQANRAARSMFGKKVVGQKCYRAFRMRDSMCEQCPATMTYEKKKSAFVEHRIFGNAITRINTYPLFDSNGEVRAIINHKRDVTMERQLEDLKANFLAGVSHELRTPLTSIIGFNKLNLKRMSRHLAPHLETAPHKTRLTFRQIIEDMEVMVSESERLGRLVNDILDLSKLEAGRMDLNFSEVDLGQIIQSAIASTSALWREKNLKVRSVVGQDTPTCWADSDRLIQVLMNLLSNAIKFTDADDIVVSTSVSRWHVCVSVRDSGPGIAPEDQQTIFEKFRQTSAGQQKGGGTGLGLPICRELIQLHRGKLWVDSVLGDGATFSFTVLRADRKDEQEKSGETRTSFSGHWNIPDFRSKD